MLPDGQARRPWCVGAPAAARSASGAISRQIKETTRTTISIPKALRLHQLLRAVSRDAAGTLKIGTRTLEVDGLVGRLSLKGHATTH